MEITILKVTHSGEDQARKLIPYIKACDVYSRENLLLTEDEAIEEEREWEGALRMSRSEFRKDQEALDMDDRFSSYSEKEEEYLHRNQKPIWYLERFPAEEAREAKELQKELEKHRLLFYEGLVEGNTESLLQHAWDYLGLIYKITGIRDAHIGRNISSAENNIRERYPTLRGRDIKFTVCIGSEHYPETHTKIECKIIDLSSRQPIADGFRSSYKIGSVDLAKRPILAYALSELMRSKGRNGVLVENQILGMPVDELCEAIETGKLI